jgi:hypothetical protein
MGIASSKNFVNTAVDVLTKVVSNIIASNQLSNNNTTIIHVSDVTGNVDISGNVVEQQANVNMTQVLDVLASDQVTEQFRAEMDQAVKSSLSDLNIFQWSDARNEVESVMKASVEITKNLKNVCATSTSNTVSIVVEHINGNIRITGNLIRQMAQILTSCSQKAISSSNVLQTFDQKLQQSAKASASGININFIAIAVAAVVAVFGAASISVGRIAFPLMVLVGSALIIYSFTTRTTRISCTAYSRLILNSSCQKRVHYDIVGKQISPQACAQICEADPNIVAFDYQEVNVVDSTGVQTKLKDPVGTFYTFVDDNCRTSFIEKYKDATETKNQVGINWTGFKVKSDLNKTTLYVSFAMIVAGLLGSVVQFSRQNKVSSNSSAIV